MSHTAVELFPSWYTRGVSKDVSEVELNIRRDAIAGILKINDKVFWIKMLKVYVGIERLNSSAYTEIVDNVRKGDVNFLIQNENVVRVISGCAIAQKIEENQSYISDMLALSLMTTEFMSQYSGFMPDLQKLARTFWLAECEQKRTLNTNFSVNDEVLKSTVKPVLPAISVEPNVLQAHADAMGKLITGIQKEVSSLFVETNLINGALEEVKKNFVALSEETNVLWWLFGAYSSTVEKPFNKLSPHLLSILIALELKKLTVALPGIGGIESIIHKALSNVEFEAGSLHSIESIVDSVKDQQGSIKPMLSNDHKDLEPLTPLAFALRCFSDYASTEWMAVFSRTVNLDLASKITFAQCSFQLYKELMLINLFDEMQ
ncbi:MAG TPA: GTPase-associated system all-helical protein GASH [Puia sp.]|nr:GTPase-associated system all-helical protein GASH [Puia sp.]